jgi:hypothetical protein
VAEEQERMIHGGVRNTALDARGPGATLFPRLLSVRAITP